jgi:hypothetical protein
MLCLGPGPPSLLHLTRANAEKPYAGNTSMNLSRKILLLINNNLRTQLGFKNDKYDAFLI